MAGEKKLPVWSLFAAFTTALAFGMRAVLNDGSPIEPVLAVAGYSLVLLAWASVTRLDALWAGSAADSPYFLGFLLTLAALYHAFDVAGLAVDSSAAPRLLAQAGRALVPTGVGLLVRQLFVSLGDRSTAKEDSHQATEAVRLQATLQNLVEVTEKSLQRDEIALEKIFSKLVTELEKIRSDAIIGDIKVIHERMLSLTKEFTDAHKSILTQEVDAHAKWATAIKRVGSDINELAESSGRASAVVRSHAAVLITELRKTVHPFKKTSSDLLAHLADLDTKSGELTRHLGATQEGLSNLIKQQKELGLQTAKLTSDLVNAQTVQTDLNKATAAIPNALASTSEAVEKEAKRLLAAVESTLSPLQREVQEIDALISDLTKILTVRVENLEKKR